MFKIKNIKNICKKNIKEYNKKYSVNIKSTLSDDTIDRINILSIVEDDGIKLNKRGTLRKTIIYYSLLNMFNYNFWNDPKIKNEHRSKELNIIFEKYIYNNLKVFDTDKIKFFNKLLVLMENSNFKCKDNYINDIKKLFIINYHNFNRDIEIMIQMLLSVNKFNNITNDILSHYIKFLKRYFCGYGNDQFFKREFLAWNQINQVLEIKERTEVFTLPIDYRLPSILFKIKAFNLPVNLKRYFEKDIILSKEDELVIRSISYLTLLDMKRYLVKKNRYEMDYNLDNKLFNLWNLIPDIKHFKFNTTDY